MLNDILVQHLTDYILRLRSELAVTHAAFLSILCKNNLCTIEEFEDIKQRLISPVEQAITEADDKATKEWEEDNPQIAEIIKLMKKYTDQEGF